MKYNALRWNLIWLLSFLNEKELIIKWIFIIQGSARVFSGCSPKELQQTFLVSAPLQQTLQ